MRIIRTVVVGLLAALLGLSAFVTAPVQADQAARTQADRSLPKRTIVEQEPDDHQINYNTFLLKGKISELQVDGVTYLPYAKKKVQLQKKACRKGCNFKTVKKFKTNEKGKFQVRLGVPNTGRWKWRVKVKGSNGFGTTKGEVWTLLFR